MKTNLTTLKGKTRIFFLLLTFFSLLASAQKPVKAWVFINSDSASVNVLKMLYESRNRMVQDPQSPRFVMVDNSGNYVLGIGGFVAANISSDFNGLSDKDFVIYDIPVPTAKFKDNKFNFALDQSRLFVKLVGNTELGRLVAYVETDFRGGSGGLLHLRQAYVSFKNLLVGQTWSTFMDLDGTPYTLDFEGPNSMISIRQPMIRYTLPFAKRWSLEAALEVPTISYSTRQDMAPLSFPQSVPDIPARLIYSAGFGHIQLAGLLRTLIVPDTLVNGSNHSVGYGFAFSGSINLPAGFKFQYQATYGKGISHYINGLKNRGLDLLYNPATRSTSLVPIWGGYVNLARTWGRNGMFTSNLLYGQANADIHDAALPHQYKRGYYFAINTVWTFIKYGTVGVEFLHGARTDINGEKGDANRINALLRYNF
ncbi:DcaP family trimeric outer membrane transporter [Parabacteroides pacaensis]|uniref:DcaP family trimeric outer membrane transporter n=1 Tax=Parabacteroides pacaensis TaxID=2086575 RepID=UPI000D10AF60|nr:DcaP family trimeric outer membrane transporter [Parabacteroides pacaensis]